MSDGQGWPHRLVLGTYLNLERDEGLAHELIGTAFALGITAFDVADAYGDGAAERVLGRALAGRDRDTFTLIGKIGRPTSLGTGLSRAHVQRSLARSLEHLGVEHLDVLLAHAPDPAVHPAALAATFDTLIDAGRIRAWGTSQFSPQALLRLAHATELPGGMRMEQPSYSLRERWIENGRLPAAVGAGVAVVPHSTLSGGVLTGKYASGPLPGSRATDDPQALAVDEQAIADSAAIAAIAADHGTGPLEAALGWVLSQPGVSGAVVGARTPEQLERLAAAAALRPGAALLSALDRRFPGPGRRRDRLRAMAWQAAGHQVDNARSG
jgi:aryl-alcohol dehydrogenase-like predicted oxidoreductase